VNENQPEDPRIVLMTVMAVAILAIAGAPAEVQLAFVAVLIGRHLNHDR
jgi:hypothetical protein